MMRETSESLFMPPFLTAEKIKSTMTSDSYDATRWLEWLNLIAFDELKDHILTRP